MTERNIRLLIAFDGGRFSGWQKQKNTETIQGAIERCLRKMTGSGITLHGAGRTDAGVHALGMVANFRTVSAVPCSGFLKGLNSMLPRDIRILEAEEAAADFHSRYSAVGKSYRYDICTGAIQLPTERLYCAHFPGRLDIAEMNECLQAITGSHDFTSFEGSGSRDTDLSSGRGAVRTLHHASFSSHSGKPGHWSFRFIGDGFLRHMVRNLVGTVIDVGRGRLNTDDFQTVLQARNRSAAAPTAPAHGLFLEKVFYGGTISTFNPQQVTKPRQPMFKTCQPFILASSSPRRIELLSRFGLVFASVPAEVVETPAAGEKPADFAMRMARDKANYAAALHPTKWTIGADTVITVDGRTILGKPKDRTEALSILRQLSGRDHRVMTGICLCRRDRDISITRVEETRVTFLQAADELLQAYIASGEPMDKAGAYGIQGQGSVLAEKIDGSCSNVIGLPISSLMQLLMAYGIIVPLCPE